MALPIMIAATEYWTKATEARQRAESTEDPHFKEAFSLHALKWESLAITADIQAQEEVEANNRRIGRALEDYVAGCRSDLLVMGAYGRSRVKEIILGGATEHMLRDPKVPLFLVH